jgi:hypothetical protein
MASSKTRLYKLKIIYKYSPDGDSEKDIAHNEHIKRFYQFVENDSNINLCYLLSIEEVRLTSILLEFDTRKQVDVMEKDLEGCGFDLNLVEIKKVTGNLKTIKNNYLIIALEQGTLPYVHHRKEFNLYSVLLGSLK